MRPIDRLPVLTLLLAVSAVAIHLQSPDVAAALQFDRTAVAGGELWRLVTAHLTHFGANHLAWDVGVLFGLGWFCERESRRLTAVAVGLAAAAISAAVWFTLPTLQIYRGLSGLDCALFGLLATRRLQHPAAAERLTGAAALLALLAKSGWETLAGTNVFVSGGEFVPVPLAHLVGAACGVVAALGHRQRVSVQRSAFSRQSSAPWNLDRGRVLTLVCFHHERHKDAEGTKKDQSGACPILRLLRLFAAKVWTLKADR